MAGLETKLVIGGVLVAGVVVVLFVTNPNKLLDSVFAPIDRVDKRTAHGARKAIRSFNKGVHGRGLRLFG